MMHLQRRDRFGIDEGDRAMMVAELDPQPSIPFRSASARLVRTGTRMPDRSLALLPSSSSRVPPSISTVTPRSGRSSAEYVGSASTCCGISI